MRIICEYAACGPSYVRTGLGRAFAALGHEFIFWMPDQKPIFDVFYEKSPIDIFIGSTYNVDAALFKCLRKSPETKVALFGSAWGELVDQVDTAVYPIVKVNEQEKRNIELLKKEIGKPDFVFIHVTEKYLNPTMGGWREIGVEPIGLLNAADTFDYLGGKFDPLLACDLGFVGGYWPYKARNLDKFLLPLLQPGSNLNAKIFGNQVWPVPQYLGNLESHKVKDLFVSATVCPNVSEPHSTNLGWDCIERPLKVLVAGGFGISDFVDEWREIFNEDELIMAKTAEEFKETIEYFVRNPDKRLPFIEAGRKKVLAEHTYFDRVKKMLGQFGFVNSEVDETKTKFIQGRVNC